MIVAGAAAISDQAARQELWLSFGSVLRSYLAAALLNSPHHAFVLAPATDSVVLVAPQRTLRLTMETAGGHGAWSCEEQGGKEPARGCFRLLLDGTIAWSGAEPPGASGPPQEMDALAIALTRQLLA